MNRRALVFLAVLLCGCSGIVVTDGGVDAGERDAGRLDAGRPDAGGDDAGASPDSGSGDDAGPDAGSDAGPSLCASDDDCAAPTPACDVASGACVECTTDAHCADASAPLCDLATFACAPRTLLLAALAYPTPFSPSSLHLASHRDGAWTTVAVADPTESLSPGTGGGLAVTGIDRGILVLRGGHGEFFSAEWSGTWGSLERQGTVAPNLLSPPYPVAGGAVLAHETGITGYPLALARYEDGAGWTSLDEPTGARSSNATPPAVVTDRSGAAVVIVPPDGTDSYHWTSDTGGTWAALADIPNAAAPDTTGSFGWTTTVRRAGTDEIVAAFRSRDTELRVATFSGGAWSSAVSLATDLARTSQFPFMMAALRDARVALAYVDASNNVRLAFFDGTSWSAFTTVPLPTAVAGSRPFALASGNDATVALELAYIDSSYAVNHTRLAADGTWSTPAIVSDEVDFSFVYLSADAVP